MDYPGVVKEVGAQMNVAVIDLAQKQRGINTERRFENSFPAYPGQSILKIKKE